MAKKNFYVVFKGRKIGIYNKWHDCKEQVNKFSGALFNGYNTEEEAQIAFTKCFGYKTEVKNSTLHGVNTMNEQSQKKTPIAIQKSTKNTVRKLNGDEIDKMTVDVKIFTDGACSPNPGQAGSGVAIYRDGTLSELWYGLYNPTGTNNTAELNALNQALTIAKEELAKNKSVAIFCDSTYSIKCITQWAYGWKKKGWTKKGTPIKNIELIKEMYVEYSLIKNNIKIFHVNGHVGIEGNELADRMAVLGMESGDADFNRYNENLDIEYILTMKSG